MSLLFRRSLLFCLASLFVVGLANAQTETINTSGNGVATYGTTFQSAGPFPWTDLGITASASVNPGVLDINTGGSTSFTLNSTVTGSEIFTPGSTTLNLGYTPGWTGNMISAPGATGAFQSNFVYNIGPFNGSSSILNVPLFTLGSSTSLSSSLNAPIVSPPVISSQTLSGPGVSLTASLQAQAGICPLCATVASASISFNVGTQISQTIVAAPNVQYGDLVWYSTSQTFPGVAHTTFVPGTLGNVANVFGVPPASLGLTNGSTFYYNFLPVVMLNMGVSNEALVAVPASITASWDIFGAGGSESWPLGDLYELSTGPEDLDFDGTWYGSQYYSFELEETLNCNVPLIGCQEVFETPPSSGGGGLTNNGGGLPINIPPVINITGGGGSTTGYGTVPIGPLFPNDPGANGGCPAGVAAGSPQCATQITLTITPEPSGLLFLGTGLLGVAGVLRRKLRA